MPTDYSTLATAIARLTPGGGGNLVIEELGRSGPDHLRSFVCRASVSGGSYPVKGIGCANSLKEAKQEASRDFVYCVIQTDVHRLLELIGNDTSYASIQARPFNEYRNEGPIPQPNSVGSPCTSAQILHTQPFQSATVVKSSESVQCLKPTLTDKADHAVPDLSGGEQESSRPQAQDAYDELAGQFLKISVRDFELFVSKVERF